MKRTAYILRAICPTWYEIALFVACCLGVAIVPVVEYVARLIWLHYLEF